MIFLKDLQHNHAKGTPWDLQVLSPAQLAAFYRWFIFIPANLYPALTVGEFPARFVKVPADAGVESKTVESWIADGAFARMGDMWRIMERDMPRDLGSGKFVLGTDHPTVLDVLLAMVAHYMLHVKWVDSMDTVLDLKFTLFCNPVTGTLGSRRLVLGFSGQSKRQSKWTP